MRDKKKKNHFRVSLREITSNRICTQNMTKKKNRTIAPLSMLKWCRHNFGAWLVTISMNEIFWNLERKRKNRGKNVCIPARWGCSCSWGPNWDREVFVYFFFLNNIYEVNSVSTSISNMYSTTSKDIVNKTRSDDSIHFVLYQQASKICINGNQESHLSIVFHYLAVRYSLYRTTTFWTEKKSGRTFFFLYKKTQQIHSIQIDFNHWKSWFYLGKKRKKKNPEKN